MRHLKKENDLSPTMKDDSRGKDGESEIPPPTPLPPSYMGPPKKKAKAERTTPPAQQTFILGGHVHGPLEGVQSFPVLVVPGPTMSEPSQPNILQCTGQMGDGFHVISASTGDMSGYQLHNPNSSLPQGVVLLDDPQQAAGEASREKKLMKNREAAKESRKRKKEYMNNLESRVSQLGEENRRLTAIVQRFQSIHSMEFLNQINSL